MNRIEVVAAIIHDGTGRIFATQRGYGEFKDYWEFPGGKIEHGETAEEALKREIFEELEVQIVVEKFVSTIEYDYPKFHLTMHCYLCHIEKGTLNLKEHEAAKWLRENELEKIEWLPADLLVIKEIVKDKYGELVDSIMELYLGNGQERVELGIDGETFYIREKISLKELFLKGDRLYVSIEDKERRIDDFTTDTLINIKEKISS